VKESGEDGRTIEKGNVGKEISALIDLEGFRKTTPLQEKKDTSYRKKKLRDRVELVKEALTTRGEHGSPGGGGRTFGIHIKQKLALSNGGSNTLGKKTTGTWGGRKLRPYRTCHHRERSGHEAKQLMIEEKGDPIEARGVFSRKKKKTFGFDDLTPGPSSSS